MTHTHKKAVALGTAVTSAIFGLGILAVAATPTSQAAPCVYSGYVDRAGHYARTTDVTGGCTKVTAQHQYWPAGASRDYWTPVVEHADVATTSYNAQIMAGSHWGY